jgi:hypothetical protein
MRDPRTGAIDLTVSAGYEFLEDAWHAHGDCAVTLGHQTVAETLGLDPQRAQEAIEVLEAAGVLHTWPATRPTQKRGEPPTEARIHYMVHPEVLVSYLHGRLTWPTLTEVEVFLAARSTYTTARRRPDESRAKAAERARKALARVRVQPQRILARRDRRLIA